ncbi:hypothetical protein B0J12DRAFT_255917 [Macrophomina phaseolina]|uniref:SET domain-containing protein n=1 Tax=Macrophomina phaseolina TaxID=35725 RepID=A0ABQ8FZD0_9PEZI|nr:hypothetical protein B0J12DRAFT_255917 [Macrophomina phaseolina]
MIEYEFREVPGAGTATFATQDISRWSLIMCEKPLISMRTDQASKTAVDIWNEYEAMSDEDKAKYQTLVYTRPNLVLARRSIIETFAVDIGGWTDEMQHMAIVAATFWTNCFSTSAGPYVASVYHANSKLNHSCANNMGQWTLEDGSQAMVALRNIKAGEQLTCPYIRQDATYAVRRALLRHYDFSCRCALCEIETYISDHPEMQIVLGGSVQSRQALDDMVMWLRHWFAKVQDQTESGRRKACADELGMSLPDAVSVCELGIAILRHILEETHTQTQQPYSQIQPTYQNLESFTNISEDMKEQFPEL